MVVTLSQITAWPISYCLFFIKRPLITVFIKWLFPYSVSDHKINCSFMNLQYIFSYVFQQLPVHALPRDKLKLLFKRRQAMCPMVQQERCVIFWKLELMQPHLEHDHYVPILSMFISQKSGSIYGETDS